MPIVKYSTVPLELNEEKPSWAKAQNKRPVARDSDSVEESEEQLESAPPTEER